MGKERRRRRSGGVGKMEWDGTWEREREPEGMYRRDTCREIRFIGLLVYWFTT